MSERAWKLTTLGDAAQQEKNAKVRNRGGGERTHNEEVQIQTGNTDGIILEFGKSGNGQMRPRTRTSKFK